MNCILCVIYDKIAKQYSMPLAYNNLECAKRHFLQMVKNQPNLNGDDYVMYKISDYSIDTGEIVNYCKEVLDIE